MKTRAFIWLLVGTLYLGFALPPHLEAEERKPSVSAQGETYTYTVIKGDTLWDICEELYGTAWVWPKVWQLNPHITNPHWIYPGNQLEVFRELPEMAEQRGCPALGR